MGRYKMPLHMPMRHELHTHADEIKIRVLKLRLFVVIGRYKTA